MIVHWIVLIKELLYLNNYWYYLSNGKKNYKTFFFKSQYLINFQNYLLPTFKIFFYVFKDSSTATFERIIPVVKQRDVLQRFGYGNGSAFSTTRTSLHSLPSTQGSSWRHTQQLPPSTKSDCLSLRRLRFLFL